MNCQDFEDLMADALGGELSDDHRADFDAHLAGCPTCRAEYESLRSTIEATRKLAAPRTVRVLRDGDRLVIQVADAAASTAFAQPAFSHERGRGLLRFAASVLISFTAGYALHAGLMMADDARPPAQVSPSDDARPSVRALLAGSHVEKPARSGLAKCLATVTRTRP